MKNRAGLRLPDFIGVGPARTGTTWLHRVLEGHVGVPERYKEVHFFDRYYSRGMAWYANHFAQYPAQLKVGEITPNYFYSPPARSRIAEDIPECKIICTIREPVARMHSVYRLMCRLGKITQPSFERALDQHRSIKVNHYRYAYDLRLWLAAFDRERVLVCLYDDLESDPQAHLNRITDFLGTPRISIAGSRFATQRIHSIPRAPLRPYLAAWMWQFHRATDRDRGYNFRRIFERLGIWQYCLKEGEPFPPLDPDLEARLRERFLPDIEALEEIIGRDLTAWKLPRRNVEQSFRSGSDAGVVAPPLEPAKHT